MDTSVGGPTVAGVCYAGCAAAVCACFISAGFIYGTVPLTFITTVPALKTCLTGFSACEAACMAMLVAPTP